MNLAQRSEEQILRIADPIMDNLMSASTAINHPRDVQLLGHWYGSEPEKEVCFVSRGGQGRLHMYRNLFRDSCVIILPHNRTSPDGYHDGMTEEGGPWHARGSGSPSPPPRV